MTTSKKSANFRGHQLQKRLTRIRQAKQFILEKTSGSLMNNQKWLSLFEWIQENKIDFAINTLLPTEIKTCDFIRELESTSLLTNDSGDFIEFLEIESVSIPGKKGLTTFLNEANIDFLEEDGRIVVHGYNL